MTHEEFIIWLNGFFDISGAKTLNEEQVQKIKDKLAKFSDKSTDKHEEVEEEVYVPPVTSPVPYISQTCTCGWWNSTWCPIHGPILSRPDWTYRPLDQPFWVTCSTSK